MLSAKILLNGRSDAILQENIVKVYYSPDFITLVVRENNGQDAIISLEHYSVSFMEVYTQK